MKNRKQKKEATKTCMEASDYALLYNFLAIHCLTYI